MLKYVSATTWSAKGPFSFCLLQTSNQVLNNLLRPFLSFFSPVCVCAFLTNCLGSEREDVCVERRMQRSRIELDPDYREVQVCRDRLTRVELR